MAVQVLEEQLWYKTALASEDSMLKTFGSLRIWMNSKYASLPPPPSP
jgi:hypothetical protein